MAKVIITVLNSNKYEPNFTLARVPCSGESIAINETIYKVVDVVFTPNNVSHDAALAVRELGKPS